MGARPLPVQNLQTFTVDTPPATHWRPASCAEVDCGQYLNGWVTRLHQGDAHRIHLVRTSGRRPARVYHEAAEIVFVFEAGTPCFQAHTHRVRLDRPELYIVQRGRAFVRTAPDGSRIPRDPRDLLRQHTRPELFVEDMAEQTDAAVKRL